MEFKNSIKSNTMFAAIGKVRLFSLGIKCISTVYNQ